MVLLLPSHYHHLYDMIVAAADMIVVIHHDDSQMNCYCCCAKKFVGAVASLYHFCSHHYYALVSVSVQSPRIPFLDDAGGFVADADYYAVVVGDACGYCLAKRTTSFAKTAECGQQA